MTCERCGEEHTGCAAHSRGGGPCRNRPMRGQRVCKMHGGRAPQAKAAAERRLEREAVEAEMTRLGVPLDVDPEEALLGLVREAAGNVAFLRGLVAELKPGVAKMAVALAEGDDGVKIRLAAPEQGYVAGPDDPEKFTAKPHVLVVLYGEWCDRLAQYAALALRAGVEERRVRLAERDADQLMTAVVAALDATGLTPGQQEAFRVALADQLRRLAAPAALGA